MDGRTSACKLQKLENLHVGLETKPITFSFTSTLLQVISITKNNLTFRKCHIQANCRGSILLEVYVMGNELCEHTCTAEGNLI